MNNSKFIMTFMSFLIASCSNIFEDCRAITGDYCITRWEDGETFYLDVVGNNSDEGGGVLDGTVSEVGWNNDYIVLKKRSNFRGDPDGWVIVDVKSHLISKEKVNLNEFDDMNIKGIRPRKVQDVWQELASQH